MDFDERKQSEWSGDFNYINRLTAILYACNEYSSASDAHGWFHQLMILYRELSTEFSTKNKEENTGKEHIKNLKPLITIYVNKLNRRGSADMSEDLYNKLNEFELFLRSVLKSSGLQNKMKDPAGESLR